MSCISCSARSYCSCSSPAPMSPASCSLAPSHVIASLQCAPPLAPQHGASHALLLRSRSPSHSSRCPSLSLSPTPACRSSCASCPAETIPDEAVVALNLPVLAAALGSRLPHHPRLRHGARLAQFAASVDSAAQGSARSSSGRAQQRLLGGFVVTEIALSLALLTLAGLMIRSLVALESVPISFNADHTLVAGIPLQRTAIPTPTRTITSTCSFSIASASFPACSAATIDGCMAAARCKRICGAD